MQVGVSEELASAVTPTASRVESAIDKLFALPAVKDLVACYLEGPPKTKFAGLLFDSLEPNPHDKVDAADLVAVSLLDVRFGAKAVHQLLIERVLDKHLEELTPTLPLWALSDVQIRILEAAFDALCKLEGVGRTKATKLLARKRPLSAPITDSLVEAFYGSRDWGHFRPLATVLSKRPDLIRLLESMTPRQGASSPSVLRVLDIAIWMTSSKSTTAQDARIQILGSPEPISQLSRTSLSTPN